MTRKPVAALLALMLFMAGCWALDSQETEQQFDDVQEFSCVNSGTAAFEYTADGSTVIRCTEDGSLVSPQKVVRCPRGQSEATQVNSNTISVRCGPKPTTTTTTTSTTTTSSTTTTTVPAGTLYWHGNAEIDVDQGDDRTNCMDKELSGTGDTLTIVNDPFDSTNKVYKATIIGDGRAEWNEAYENCSGANPVDLWGPDSPPGDEIYIGWRSLYTGNYGLNGEDNGGNILQWKGRYCEGPAVGGTINNHHLSLRTLDGDPPGVPIAWLDEQSFLDRMGEWHDYVMRVNFSTTSSGYIELWIDGEPQLMSDGTFRHEGPTVDTNDCSQSETRVYPKWGVYSLPSSSNAQHYLDDPKLGSTYAIVAP
jgi:hypothetical protein